MEVGVVIDRSRIEDADIKIKKEGKLRESEKTKRKKKRNKILYARFEPRTFTSIHKKNKPYRRNFFRDWVIHRNYSKFQPVKQSATKVGMT